MHNELVVRYASMVYIYIYVTWIRENRVSFSIKRDNYIRQDISEMILLGTNS